ncbi:MAG: hypothetical protein AAF766_22305, partial [Cyanobacteria bacterium P01_D01_bin.14]
EDPAMLAELKTILGITLADNRQAWELQSNGEYQQRHPGEDEPDLGSQRLLMERATEAAGLH